MIGLHKIMRASLKYAEMYTGEVLDAHLGEVLGSARLMLSPDFTVFGRFLVANLPADQYIYG